MQHFSLLDLAPVVEGQTPAQALANSRDLAVHAEGWGYHRYWLAEHHNMPGIASAATSLVIGHVAAATKTMRIGAGGIMLPNHSPLIIAEQFGTLATLYPDRIDLGLGRAPGTDGLTARALRRNLSPEDSFPQDVVELMTYLDDPDPEQPMKVRAFPGEGTKVPIWILGSSIYGAQLAAYLGLPYAFASHFAPDYLSHAIETYRATFRPSAVLQKPYLMVAAGCFAAETDAEATYLRSSQVQSFVRLRTGQPGKLPPPIESVEDRFAPLVLNMVNHALSVSAVGSPATLERRFSEILEQYQPDELMITGMMHDHQARLRSFEIASEVLTKLKS